MTDSLIEHHLRVGMGGFCGNVIYFNDGIKDAPGTKTIKLKHRGKLVVKYVRDPEFFQREASMMRELEKYEMRNVLKCLWVDAAAQCILFDRYDNDLFDIYADPLQVDALSKEVRRKIVVDLADAIIDLHTNGISHRDIKPDNVLVNRTENGLEIALCDFGLASFSSRIVRDRHLNVGSAPWIAVETLMTEDYDTAPTDWWSFGLIAYLIITGSPLYADHATHIYRDHFIRIVLISWDNWWRQFPTDLTAQEKQLIESCVCVDVSKRANASTLKSLSYFI